MRKSFAPAVMVLVLFGGGLSAEPKRIVSVEGITEYQLDNGCRILLFPDNSSPKVTVNMTVLVGSRHEGYGETGMAHLLEHMVFKGTPTHKNIPQLLTERGANFNGTTWLDRTNYYETLNAGDDNLEFAIKLEADRLVNSFIKREDLVSEFSVVRNEFERGENSPSNILSQRMTAVAYEWHNYGKSTIGNRSDIERVPIDKLQAFYKKFYQPDNVIVIVAGQFKEAKALELLQKYFGSIPRPKRQLDATYTEEPAQDGERFVNLRRVGDVGVVGVIYHIPAGAHPDFPAVQVLSRILTAQPAGRLYKALVQSEKATSVYGFAMALHDPGIIEIAAEVRRGKSLEDARDTMLAVTEEVGAKGVTEEEVQRARQQLLSQRELAAANSQAIAIQLSDWAAQGDWRLYFLNRDRIEKVTADDVKSVAQRYLQRNNRTVGMFIPTEKAERIAIPNTPDLKTLVGDYKGREAIAAGEAFDVSPLKVEERAKRSKTSDGLKMALLPKKTRGEAVYVQLSLRFGDADNLKGFQSAAEFLPPLMRRGTKGKTYQQIQDELDKQKARLSVNGETGVAYFSVMTKKANLSAVLDLLRQILREPTFPAAEFDILKRQALAGLEEQKTDPDTLAFTALRRQLNPYPADDVRYYPTVEEEIQRTQAATLDQVKKLYQEYLSGAHGELTVVGDFNDADVTRFVAETFSGWQSPKPYARIERRAATGLKGGKESINTPDKANASYYAGLVIPMNDEDPDYAALYIGNYILGGGSLSSRLADRVRQKEGLSYGVRSSFAAFTKDPRASITIYAISNPENTEKVVTAIREELDRLLASGVTPEELERAKKGFLQEQQVQRSNDQRLASLLQTTSHYDRTLAYYADLEKKITALTTDQVNAALRKHVDSKRLYVVTAGDFGKKAAGGGR